MLDVHLHSYRRGRELILRVQRSLWGGQRWSELRKSRVTGAMVNPYGRGNNREGE
ncbi:hypothetical protein PCH70_50440 [Pseudomonas cichorii JBC1]|nr:hypothetical protein PCH70_50440 [Pseudomonas cichorii JBC1]